MSRKKHTPKAKTNKSRRSRRVAPPTPSRSMGVRALDRALGALEEPFATWLLGEGFATDTEQVEATMSTAWAAAHAMDDECPDFDLTAFGTHDLDHLIDTFPFLADDDLDGQLITAILVPTGMFASFLFDTDRWTGTDEDYVDVGQAIMEIVGGELDEDFGSVVASLDVPAIAPAAELAALQTLSLVDQLHALLRWIGDGRPVTATGALTLADVESAAVAVGALVAQGIPLQSMWKVTDLARLWMLARHLDLIAVGRTKVRLTENGRAWPNAIDPAQHAEQLRKAAGLFVALTLLEPDYPAGQQSNEYAADVLVCAFGSDPVTCDPFAELLTEDRDPNDRLTIAIQQKYMNRTLEDLGANGLLEIGASYTVDESLKPAMHLGLAVYASTAPDDGLDENPWADPHGPESTLF